MPRTVQAAATTDAYRAQLIAARDAVARSLAQRWQAVSLDDFDGTVREWIAQAVRDLTAAQRHAAQLSVGYLAAFLDAEGENPGDVRVNPDAYAGRTADGRPLTKPLTGVVYAPMVALGRGATRQQALASGLARGVRVARTEVMDAGERALSDAGGASGAVKGWRRVSAAKACGACMALTTGQVFTRGTLNRHPSCRCTAEPVLAGPEAARRPTGQERFQAMSPGQQARLFAGRGGAQKAELIRTGRARLSDLVTTQHHHQWHDTITETPLAQLVGD